MIFSHSHMIIVYWSVKLNSSYTFSSHEKTHEEGLEDQTTLLLSPPRGGASTPLPIVGPVTPRKSAEENHNGGNTEGGGDRIRNEGQSTCVTNKRTEGAEKCNR